MNCNIRWHPAGSITKDQPKWYWLSDRQSVWQLALNVFRKMCGRSWKIWSFVNVNSKEADQRSQLFAAPSQRTRCQCQGVCTKRHVLKPFKFAKFAKNCTWFHDFTWFHMMHILMHESSKSSWDMWSIAWSWVPGSKGVWNLEGAQPWEPPPSSSPNSKWSSSRPNLQGHCVALCGSASGYTESFASCLAMS